MYHRRPGGTFTEFYRCYTIQTTLNGKQQPDNVKHGGKVILPPSALAKLASLHIEYPMLFRLDNDGGTKSSHLGVLEFVAPEGHAYVPAWAMKQLQLHDGDIAKLTNVTLPLGRFLKIQPQSTDFLAISDPKAVLEYALRSYSALTQGDIISLSYNNKIYELLCMEIKPQGPGISIVETDLEVDFAPPVGYEEPKRIQPTKSMSTGVSAASLDIEKHKVDETINKFQSFSGSGVRLNGRPLTAASPLDNGPSGGSGSSSSDMKVDKTKEEEGEEVPAALRLPNNKLWFGYQVAYYTPSNADATAAPGGEGKPAQTVVGHSLR